MFPAMATTGKLLSPAPIFFLLLLLAPCATRAADEQESNIGKAAQMRRQHSLLVVDSGRAGGSSGAGAEQPEENLSRPARVSRPDSPAPPPPPSPPPSPLVAASGCDFGGRRLRVAVSQQPPLVSCLQDLYGDWLCNGSNVEVIQLLERKFNFRADWLVLAPQPFAPAPATNASGKQARGALALVASGRAWLGANGVMRTRYRSELAGIVLSEPFDAFRFHFLLSKWVRDHDHIFVKPFAADTWLALLVSALLMVPALYLVNSSSAYYRQRDHRYLRSVSLLACVRYRLAQFRRWLLRLLCCNYCCCSLAALCLARACCRPRSAGSTSSASSASSSASSSSSSGADSDEQVGAVLAQGRRRERARKGRLRSQWETEGRRARRLAKRRSGFFRPAYVAWYVAGSLAAQGGEEEELPEADSCRILVAAWWLYLVVVVSFHSGLLTAILTFPRQVDFVQTLDDFLALQAAGPPMRLWVDGHGELSHLLQSPDELFQSPLYELVEAAGGRPEGIGRVDFGRHRQRVLDEVMGGQAAYLEERSTIQLVITQEYLEQRPPRCHFKASRQPVDIVPMSLALSSRLPGACIARINQLLKLIMRAGLAQKWRRRYEPPGNDCLQTMLINAGDVETIRLRQVLLAFWLLAGGLLLGALLLLLEVVWLFTADLDGSSSSSSGSDELEGARSRGVAGGPGRRARRPRRLQRTVELMNRLREGKIYSEFFAKVSGDVRARARRASQALVAPFVQGAAPGRRPTARRRRTLRPRVAPAPPEVIHD